ncbi:MAG: class I adenylate-forming enzyme family protein [Chthoniobacterales bacterium]
MTRATSTTDDLIASDPLLATWAVTLGRHGSQLAIANTRGESLRTFAEIAAEAGRVEELLPNEFAPGAVIAVQLGNHPAWPAWLLACRRRGLAVLPLERGMAEREREAALQTVQAAALVALRPEGEVCLTRRAATAIDWGEHAPALLKMTSGTTAAPRAIRFRSEQLVRDCEQICQTMGIQPNDTNFGVIPWSHSYGFSNLLTPLLLRGVSLVLSRDRMPRALLDDLARSRATIFAGMPIFYQAFAEMEAVPALPDLRLCISAGAPLPLTVAQKFREKFGLTIHSFYGSSECGGICYDREARLEEAGFVGQAMADVEVELLETNAPASRVRVRTAAAGDGYFPEPEPEKLGRGIFVPDDLLAPSREGFRIVGRVSDLINVAGKKVNPAEIEAVLLASPGVRTAVVFGRQSTLRNEEVAACVVAAPEVTEHALREFCRQRLSGWQVPKRIFFLAEMPANERGKISRRGLARRFAD